MNWTLGVHDPDVRPGQVGNRAERAGHEPEENRRLLRDQQRRERQPHDDAEVLRLIPYEHFEDDEVHGCAPFVVVFFVVGLVFGFRRCLGGAQNFALPARPASEKLTM